MIIRLTTLFLLVAKAAFAIGDYKPGPDSFHHDGVPQGYIVKYTHTAARGSVFPGTTREVWVYVPKQYEPATPSCLYVGQDGVQFHATNVFDNLIARHEMPVTIGVFIMHGRVKSAFPNSLDRFNRSYEYDGLGDNYARFLLEEILPEVEKIVLPDGRPLHLSKNPNDRAIGGASSGAICAFTAAWERPDAFRRVFSSIGTFVDQRGGNVYPALIRKTEPKPLRVFLQDGTNDLNRVGGNWHLANEEMLSALEFAGYEVNHIWGDGGHNGKQATAIFPDAMRWLWKDWPNPIKAAVNSEQPIEEILIPGEDWHLVDSSKFDIRTTAIACMAHNSNRYDADPGASRIILTRPGGKTQTVNSGISFSHLCLTPDQTLLLADEPVGQFVYSFHINADGTLSARQPYHHLEVRDGAMRSGAQGMAVDKGGFLYVATDLGIQVCDQAGRVQGIITTPRDLQLSNLNFGGEGLHELYLSGGGKVYKRKLQAAGALPFLPPVKPSPPSL